jgi:exodeoxyribonuclease VII large subunit
MLTREIEHQARHLQRLAVSPSLRSPQKQIDDRRLTVDRLAERGEIAAANLMTKLTLALAKSSARLQALDPRRVLERGYALVESSDGRLLRQALQTNRGEQVHVRLWQGALTCRIEEVES